MGYRYRLQRHRVVTILSLCPTCKKWVCITSVDGILRASVFKPKPVNVSTGIVNTSDQTNIAQMLPMYDIIFTIIYLQTGSCSR